MDGLHFEGIAAEDIKRQLAYCLQKVMDYLEHHYEKTVDEYGIESQEAEDHPYSLARDIWALFELETEDF